MINITIVCDGTSDLCLSDITQGITDSNFPNLAFRITPARDVIPAHAPLVNRLRKAFDNYGPNIIICHRDSENISHKDRECEILNAQTIAKIPVPIVPAVPVRMIESWLLTDASAIRCAADNRNGRANLSLPAIRTIEKISDPKEILFNALRCASELPTQRLRKFNEHRARSRISSFIEDFTEMRKLASFSHFENSLIFAINHHIELTN